MDLPHIFGKQDTGKIKFQISKKKKFLILIFFSGKIFITIMARKRVKLYYEELPELSDKVQRKTDNGMDPQHLPVKMEKSKMKDGTTEEKCSSQCNNLNLQRINKLPAITL